MILEPQVVVDIFVRSVVVLSLTAIVWVALRKSSASSRHGALAIALFALALLPFLVILTPHWQSPWLWVHRTQLAPPVALSQPAAGFSDPLTPSIKTSHASISWWAVVWAIGSLLLLARLFVGLNEARLQKKTRRRLTGGPLWERVQSLTKSTRFHLILGDDDQPPMTWGCMPPVLLLPSSAESWPEDRLRAVVLHEVAHVERADWLTQTLAKAICAAYWFHPGVWLLAHLLERESECAADDRVLSLGCPPEEYGRHLVDVARALAGRTRLKNSVAMARKNPIRMRLEAILTSGLKRRPLTRSGLYLFGISGLALTSIVATAGPREVVVSPKNPGDSAVPAEPFVPAPTLARMKGYPAKHVKAKTAIETRLRDLAEKPNPSRESVVAFQPKTRLRDVVAAKAQPRAISPPSPAIAPPAEMPSIPRVGAQLASYPLSPEKGKEINEQVNEAVRNAADSVREAERAAKDASKNLSKIRSMAEQAGVPIDIPAFKIDVPEIRIDNAFVHLKSPAVHVYVPAVLVRASGKHKLCKPANDPDEDPDDSKASSDDRDDNK